MTQLTADKYTIADEESQKVNNNLKKKQCKNKQIRQLLLVNFDKKNAF